MQHHNYSLSDVENMMPWERDIYVQMLIEYIKQENKKYAIVVYHNPFSSIIQHKSITHNIIRNFRSFPNTA